MTMSDDHDDFDDFDDASEDEFEEVAGDPLDEHETILVQQDLIDLEDFEATFSAEGYRGVAVWCHDCAEDHFYPWDMLRENLNLLLQTGETPVHEPAFHPNPDEYVPWEYARGYVDALRDVGVEQRLPIGTCERCGFSVPEPLGQANFCPRCGSPLLAARVVAALRERDVTAEEILREIGLPG
jgi:RNase P subunit RPR2